MRPTGFRPAPLFLVRPLSFRPPPFERLRLASGLELITTEYPAVPMVHLLGAVPAGGLCDPPGQEGLAALTLLSLREGTCQCTADQITEQTEDRGADLSLRLSWEIASLAVELLEDDLDYGLELFAQLLWFPTF